MNELLIGAIDLTPYFETMNSNGIYVFVGVPTHYFDSLIAFSYAITFQNLRIPIYVSLPRHRWTEQYPLTGRVWTLPLPRVLNNYIYIRGSFKAKTKRNRNPEELSLDLELWH